VLQVELNRIDGSAALPALQPGNVLIQDDVGLIGLWEATDLDVELYFPAPGGIVRNDWLELARDVLSHLAEMDNEVQRVSAEQCARSGLHSRNYEGFLSHITLAGPEEVVLRYFGTGVNTEWDERFVRTNGEWVMARPA
jgi:hypothetical protein